MNQLFVILMVAISACGNTVKLDPKNLIRIEGTIDESLMPTVERLERTINSTKDAGQIDVLINSPGGVIAYGMQFISVMKRAQHRGFTFRCVVGHTAASMAFIILSHCDKRAALPESNLLFHPPRIILQGFMGVAVTPTQAREIAAILSRVERRINPFVRRSLGMDTETYNYYYIKEIWWTPAELNEETQRTWIEVLDDIEGVHIYAPEVDRSAQGLIWIAPEAV